MSIKILMPALSPTMTEGNLANWLVKEGDKVEAGDMIAEIETDKATMEVEAIDEGVVAKIIVESGSKDVAVNSLIMVLAEEGEDIKSINIDELIAENDENVPEQDNISIVNDGPVESKEEASVSKNTATAYDAEDNNDIGDEWDGQYKNQTVREALRDAMLEEMENDKSVFLMGEEVAEYEGAYKVSQELLKKFGDKRVIDTPITEHGFTGLAIGAAMKETKPIVEFMTWNFAMQAIDQIINSAAKTLYMSGGQMGAPIVFRGPNGAAARVGAQHSQCYGAWYSHIPGLKVISPYSASDAKGLLKSAIRDPNPIVFLENEILYGEKFDVPDCDDWTVPIGKAKIVKKGRNVTICTFSIMVGKALLAANELEEKGISVEVIDLRTLRPLDTKTIINSVKKTNRLVTVEEGWGTCGIGAEISALAMSNAFDYLDAPVTRVHAKDVPLPYAANLEKLALPQINDIVDAVEKVCYK